MKYSGILTFVTISFFLLDSLAEPTLKVRKLKNNVFVLALRMSDSQGDANLSNLGTHSFAPSLGLDGCLKAVTKANWRQFNDFEVYLCGLD